MTVKIVWDGIDRRITQLTHMPGSVMFVVPAPDSRTYLFSAHGRGGRRRRRAAGPACTPSPKTARGMTQLNTTSTDAGAAGRGRGGRGGGGGGGEPQWARDGRSIYFLQGGGLYSLAIGGGAPADTAAAPAAAGRTRRARWTRRRRSRGRRHRYGAAGAAPRRINFSVRMEIDIPAERRQVFEEAWRVMKNRFYDAKMHGVDWAAAKDTYETVLPHIADTEELHNLIMEMIGDINASHTGISGGSRAARAGRRPKSGSQRAIPASISSPMPAASTRSATSTARVRPTTITSSSRPATSSSPSTARS